MQPSSNAQSSVPSRPRVMVGIYIFNSRGEILMVRSSKWSNLLSIPSGHVEYGETLEAAVLREAKEETGLDVQNPVFLTVHEMIEPKNFTAYRAHFIGLEYRVELARQEQIIALNDEGTEYIWLMPKAILQRTDVEPSSVHLIRDHCLKISEKSEEKNVKEYKEGWQRAVADYQNLKKEVERMRSEWGRLSELQILEEFLPVYTNFKKAFSHANGDSNRANGEANVVQRFEGWKKGIGYIMKQFGDILKAHGIDEMKVEGEIFDAAKHESVGEEAADGVVAGTILKEVESGYLMNGKVIKPAKVLIAK